MTDNISDSLITHQREMEWQFAGAFLEYENLARERCGWLQPDQFKDEEIRAWWKLVREGVGANTAALKINILRKILNTRLDYIIPGSAEAYANAIADDFYLQYIADALPHLATMTAERKTAEIQTRLVELAKVQVIGQSSTNLAVEAALEFAGSLDDKSNAIKTGLSKIDNTFGGFSRGSLTILGARPSMGKTSLALMFARGCIDHGRRVLYISIEMTKEALWARMVCGAAELDFRKFKRRDLSEVERCSLIESNNNLIDKYGEKLFIDDHSTITTREIWQAAIQHRPDLLIVDHLGLVNDQGDNEVRRLGQISWAGKQIAKEVGCASLYLMQLNRALESRENKMPTLADIRGSGEIEQNADSVFFIHRADYYGSTASLVSPTDLLLAKDREGARNVIYKLHFNLLKQDFFEEVSL